MLIRTNAIRGITAKVRALYLGVQQHVRRHPLFYFLLLLYLPFAVLLVGLKIVRTPFFIETGLFSLLDLFRSEIFFVIFLGFGMAVLLGRNGKLSVTGVVLSVVIWGGLWLFEVIAHCFYTISGGTALGSETIFYALSNLASLQKALLSELPKYAERCIWLGVGLGALSLAVRPWRAPIKPGNLNRRRNLVIASGALVISLLPTFTNAGLVVSRDLVLSTVAGGLDVFSEEQIEIQAHHFPTDASISRGDSFEARNVALIVLESARAMSTTIHRSAVGTTPFLAELAKQSLVAMNAHTPVPRTSKALVSLLCGIRPNFSVTMSEGNPGGIPARCLPQLLNSIGYRSAYFQSSWSDFDSIDRVMASAGFDDFFGLEDINNTGYEEINYHGYEDQALLPASKTWLQARKTDQTPFFATYMTITGHHEYSVPRRHKIIPFHEDDRINRYMNTIRYMDDFIEKLISQYKTLGLYEDTLFVIVSDHGEAFDEHGRSHHNTVIYQEGLHIPTLMHDPRNPIGKTVNAVTTHLDILPTVVEALGLHINDASYPGTSLLQPIPERPLLAACFRARACATLRRGDLKVIHHFGTRADELFDLNQDPEERTNLFEARSVRGNEMLQELLYLYRLQLARHRLFHKQRLSGYF